MSDHKSNCSANYGVNACSCPASAPDATATAAQGATLTDQVADFLGKLIEFADADYVPNSLFDRARDLLAAAKPVSVDAAKGEST